jgi:hypothetical protein
LKKGKKDKTEKEKRTENNKPCIHQLIFIVPSFFTISPKKWILQLSWTMGKN